MDEETPAQVDTFEDISDDRQKTLDSQFAFLISSLTNVRTQDLKSSSKDKVDELAELNQWTDRDRQYLGYRARVFGERFAEYKKMGAQTSARAIFKADELPEIINPTLAQEPKNT